MSRAGARSNQGDEYQRLVALHWLIRLLKDSTINGVQADSLGIPGEEFRVTADDVVVLYADGRIRFNLLKKNEPKGSDWKLGDRLLQEELRKARDQLEARENSEVWLWSRSPFGRLKSLLDDCKAYPDLVAFQQDAPESSLGILARVAGVMERTSQATFGLLCRIDVGDHHGFEAWERINREALGQVVADPDRGMRVLRELLDSHQNKLGGHPAVLTRDVVLASLAREGLFPSAMRSEAEILTSFRAASAIGRNWLRAISGERILRQELGQVLALLEQGRQSVVVTDGPGTGKTCLLLDLADRLEELPNWGLLFVKSDRFADVETEADLEAKGLPSDIVGLCARLGATRRVAVVIDSLDVLSLSRQQKALQVFLGLMDRLERTPGISVVAACREFDLRYDPALRGRQWQETVRLQPLSFDDVVAPFLRRWGIGLDAVGADLRELLAVPENLRVFEKLAVVGAAPRAVSALGLHDLYLEEVVGRDPLLGGPALASLESMAEELAHGRTQSLPRPSFTGSPAAVQRLVSQQVLFEPAAGALGFAHQTVLETLLIRQALGRGQTLLGFIQAHPPLPFIRPAVRSFFFYLRAHDPVAFRRQVWAALADQGVAYHLKRLLAESLVEIAPEEEDWPFVRRFFQDAPDLFHRLLRRTDRDDWFVFLRDRWLPLARTAPDRERWLLTYANRLRTWANRRPADVVALWRAALVEHWATANAIVSAVTFGLHDFTEWQTEGLEDLFSALVELARGEHDMLGRPLSLWVTATDRGDEILWRYITRDVEEADASRWQLSKKLRCEPHVFETEGFLPERFRRSDALLDLALTDLTRWSSLANERASSFALWNTFLRETSWENRHTRHDQRHVSPLGRLLAGVEEALKERARRDDSWWRENENRLRSHPEVGIRYLVLQSYRQNLQANVAGIEAQFADSALLRYGGLDYELGELLREAYPYITEDGQLAIQVAILTLQDSADRSGERGEESTAREVCTYLVRIPRVFRTTEAQRFLDRWQTRSGRMEPSPRLLSWGGFVGSPISPEGLLGLSDAGILRLLGHYRTDRHHSELTDRGLTGGRGQVAFVLQTAASKSPLRLLELLPILRDPEIGDPGYASAIVEGAANHLAYRFGNLQSPQGWEAFEPLPDGPLLAGALLSAVERPPFLDSHDHSVGRAVEACCHVLTDEEDAERLTFLLFQLSRAASPQTTEEEATEKDLDFVALNSTRGRAAESAMVLCGNLLERGQPLPELLPPLLRRFARDPVAAVRVSVVRALPFLMQQSPDLGWQLFSDAFGEPQPRLWEHAERCLYYQYREHWERVRPCLDRLLAEGMAEAGETWGRISALACLAGHVDMDRLLLQLADLPQEATWGAAQVFAGNLASWDCSHTCAAGLMAILSRPEVPEKLFRAVGHCFGSENDAMAIPAAFPLCFVQSLPPQGRGQYLHDFLRWLGEHARRDPRSALAITEVLGDRFEAMEKPLLLWPKEPLVIALAEILREADQSDDQDLIRRAVQLQDRFLRLEIDGMEELLDRATR
jgi:hypothetical protein